MLQPLSWSPVIVVSLTERMITQAYNPEKHYAVSEANKFANFLQTYIHTYGYISSVNLFHLFSMLY